MFLTTAKSLVFQPLILFIDTVPVDNRKYVILLCRYRKANSMYKLKFNLVSKQDTTSVQQIWIKLLSPFIIMDWIILIMQYARSSDRICTHSVAVDIW